jgi:hypothetical protein
MDTRNRTQARALVAQCSDEARCTIVSCAVCLLEIPADAVSLGETQDYVHHYCGLDCFEVWHKQAVMCGTYPG